MLTNSLMLKDEDFDSYAVRLYRNKEAYALTNSDIGALLNQASGNDWDESAYRKKYVPYMHGYDDGYEAGSSMRKVDRDLYIDQLRVEREQHYKSKKQLQDMLREYRKKLTVEARSEALQNTIIQAAQRVAKEKPLITNVQPIQINHGRVGVLQLSDWHFGEVIEDNVNTYNTQVCIDRLKILADEVVRYTKELNLDRLIALNLGDLISGNIRVSARVENEIDVITQTMRVSELLVELLQNIYNRTGVPIEFYSVLDNHSRVNANYAQHIEKESYSRIMHWFVQHRFVDHPGITVKENKVNGIEEYDIGRFKIYDSDFLFVHGHNDRIRNAISDISMLTSTKPVSIFMGHLHNNIEKEEFGIDLVINPSLIGTGMYAKKIRKSSKPRQKLNVYRKTEDNKAKREFMILLELEN